MEARATSGLRFSAGPYVAGSSICHPSLPSPSSRSLGLAGKGRSCSDHAFPGRARMPEGRFP